MIFRVRPADDSPAAAEAADSAGRQLLDRINAHRKIVLSSTNVNDRYTLRVCIVSHRTHDDLISDALRIIATELSAV